jgi:hypothetical protein
MCGGAEISLRPVWAMVSALGTRAIQPSATFLDGHRPSFRYALWDSGSELVAKTVADYEALLPFGTFEQV